jgi:hypothetical protein
MERSGMFSATFTSLSTVTKRYAKIKILYIHVTPPLTKPGVGGRYSFKYDVGPF